MSFWTYICFILTIHSLYNIATCSTTHIIKDIIEISKNNTSSIPNNKTLDLNILDPNVNKSMTIKAQNTTNITQNITKKSTKPKRMPITAKEEEEEAQKKQKLLKYISDTARMSLNQKNEQQSWTYTYTLIVAIIAIFISFVAKNRKRNIDCHKNEANAEPEEKGRRTYGYNPFPSNDKSMNSSFAHSTNYQSTNCSDFSSSSSCGSLDNCTSSYLTDTPSKSSFF